MSIKSTIAHGETVETESDEEMTDQALLSQASAANQQCNRSPTCNPTPMIYA